MPFSRPTIALFSDATLRAMVADLVDGPALDDQQRGILDHLQDEIEDRGSREDAAKG